MFNAGDKVRRKAEWQDNTAWTHGDAICEVEAIINTGTIQCRGQNWASVYFDLIEPTKPEMPADSSPKVEIPPQTRTGEQAMGPVERVLTKQHLQSAIGGIHHSLRDVFDQDGSGHTMSSNYCNHILAFIDAEIAAERANPPREPWILQRENDELRKGNDSLAKKYDDAIFDRDEARTFLAASELELATVTKKRDEERQRLADTTREFNAVIDRLADAEKRLAIKDEQIEKLTIVPHDAEQAKRDRDELNRIKARIDNTGVSQSARDDCKGDYVKLLDLAFVEHWEDARHCVPHDYDQLKRNMCDYEKTINRLVSDCNRLTIERDDAKQELAKWQSIYGERYDSSGPNVIAEPSKYDLLKMQLDEAKSALDNERQFFAVNHHTIEAQKDEIERLTNENAIFKQQNETLQSELANCLSSPVPSNNAPRTEIAWLIGWLNCQLSTQPLNDPPTDLCREKLSIVNAWLSGVQS